MIKLTSSELEPDDELDELLDDEEEPLEDEDDPDDEDDEDDDELDEFDFFFTLVFIEDFSLSSFFKSGFFTESVSTKNIYNVHKIAF